MNQQQLEILKDLIIEKLSEEGLDQKTREHLEDMLVNVKEEMENEMNLFPFDRETKDNLNKITI